MIIGVLIPTRGDRPQFLEHAKYLLSQQTKQPDHVLIVDEPPKDNKCDITYRYRTGCEKLFALGVDVILFWEDDDWYRQDYIEKMLTAWLSIGKPHIFGLGDTIYYHIKTNQYKIMHHPERSSMMATLLSKEAKIDWGKDDYAFTDLILWKQLQSKATYKFNDTICLGIKHGIGMAGGSAHSKKFRYDHNDQDLKYLQKVVDPKSFIFYGRQ